MNSLKAIKQGVNHLFKTHPQVHMNVNISHDKLHLKKHPVTITAVYPNIFRIEDRTGNDIRQHTIQYVELMMGHVEIVELNRQA